MSVFPKLLRNPTVLAPFIFVAHFLEEAPGFVGWFNSHVKQGITSSLFWTVNITALIITIGLTAMELLASNRLSASIIVLWFSFLILANAIFHITAAIADEAYMPGLITACILYLPFYFFVVGRIVRDRRLGMISTIAYVAAGSALMLIHGYLIVFKASRLF